MRRRRCGRTEWRMTTNRLLDQRWFQIAVAVVFLAVASISMINSWTIASYIRNTEPRDAAQEKCIVAQAEWLQDWLQWRWVEHVDAQPPEIKLYMNAHPQPACEIRR